MIMRQSELAVIEFWHSRQGHQLFIVWKCRKWNVICSSDFCGTGLKRSCVEIWDIAFFTRGCEEDRFFMNMMICLDKIQWSIGGMPNPPWDCGIYSHSDDAALCRFATFLIFEFIWDFRFDAWEGDSHVILAK